MVKWYKNMARLSGELNPGLFDFGFVFDLRYFIMRLDCSNRF